MASKPLVAKIEREMLHGLKASVGSNPLGGITTGKSGVGW